MHATPLRLLIAPRHLRGETCSARAAEEMNIGLHLDGIGEAALEDGWWGRLTSAVDSNIAMLDELEARRWWQRPGDRHLLIGDGLAAVLVCFAVGILVGTVS